MEDYCKFLLTDFLDSSFSTVKALVEGAKQSKINMPKRKINLFHYSEGKKVCVPFEKPQFYLRSSVEYTNPQLTVEEVQGIIATRLLETCANYYMENDLQKPDTNDILNLTERLKHPPEGYIIPFLLNTDDVEADRYSINPLKQSIVDSHQSAIPALNTKTDQLKIDPNYTKKYDGSLISQHETELITQQLDCCKGSYVDFVDTVKYSQIVELSNFFGMDLSLYTLRMPLSILKNENNQGLLHYIISQSNQDYASVEAAYTCMGRSMNKRTTLLTVPHSPKGFGSKRAARGKLHFENKTFLDATVTYKTTTLYPNAMDPNDVAIAHCEDKFTVTADKLANYNYAETPSSPQFFLYSLASPEDATMWHGVGAFGSSQLLHSYANARIACRDGRLIKDLNEKYNLNIRVPLQFNLAPEGLWSHPTHRNIDASIGSVENLSDLAHRGMKIEHLSAFK